MLVGCYGRDEFLAARGKDLFVLTGLGADTIIDFEDGKDRFRLADDLRFGKLKIVEAGDDAEVRFDGEVVAIVVSVDAGLLGRDDFLAL